MFRLSDVLDAKERMREAKRPGNYLKRLARPSCGGNGSIGCDPCGRPLILPRKDCRRDLVDLRQQLMVSRVGVVVAGASFESGRAWRRDHR